MFTAVVAATIPAAPSFAGDPGASGATFLKVPVDARPAAMGEAFTAIPGALSSLPYNAGGMAWASWSEAQFMHELHSIGNGAPSTNMEYLAAVVPMRKLGTFALQVRLRGYGSNPGYDEFGAPLPNWDASDLSVGLSYARALDFPFGSLGVGGGLSFVRLRVADVSSGLSPSLDLGGLWKTTMPGLSAGLSVQHVGTAVAAGGTSSPQPLTLRLGGAYDLEAMLSKKRGNDLGGLVSLDIGVPNDHLPWLGIGFEAAYRKIAFLRLGYRTGVDQEGAAGLCVGAGGRYVSKTWTGGLDVSYSPAGLLGSQLRVSLTFGLKLTAR